MLPRSCIRDERYSNLRLCYLGTGKDNTLYLLLLSILMSTLRYIFLLYLQISWFIVHASTPMSMLNGGSQVMFDFHLVQRDLSALLQRFSYHLFARLLFVRS